MRGDGYHLVFDVHVNWTHFKQLTVFICDAEMLQTVAETINNFLSHFVGISDMDDAVVIQ